MPKLYRSHLLDVYRVWVHATGTPKGWARLRTRVDCLEEDPAALGYTEGVEWVPDPGTGPHPSEYHVAVFVDVEAHQGNEARVVETCAHEATHAATMMLNHLGQQLDDVGLEAHAYLVGWLTSWLWTSVRDTASITAPARS